MVRVVNIVSLVTVGNLKLVTFLKLLSPREIGDIDKTSEPCKEFKTKPSFHKIELVAAR